MIRYALRCEKGHQFESWFASSSAYESQTRRKLVTCPACGSAKVAKDMMAPALKRADKGAKARRVTAGADNAPEPKAPVAIMSPEEAEFRQKLKEVRDHLTKNADYVGPRFPEEARRMHYGEIERRSIYGEASPQDAKELADEGIEFHPLPVLPDERN